jgi:hypothetical protein
MSVPESQVQVYGDWLEGKVPGAAPVRQDLLQQGNSDVIGYLNAVYAKDTAPSQSEYNIPDSISVCYTPNNWNVQLCVGSSCLKYDSTKGFSTNN